MPIPEKLSFNNVAVPEENLLGERGQGSKIMLATLDGGRLSIAAMGLGLAQGAFEMAMEYASKRIQFGRPIRSFQVNTFKLADMATKIELARTCFIKPAGLRIRKCPLGRKRPWPNFIHRKLPGKLSMKHLQIHGAHG